MTTTKNKNKLKVIPLGGMEEIGKNMTVFEYGDHIIVVDCGLAFPEDEMLGIDFHYCSMSRGLLDTRDVIYFISLIFLFLFVTEKKLQNR